MTRISGQSMRNWPGAFNQFWPGVLVRESSYSMVFAHQIIHIDSDSTHAMEISWCLVFSVLDVHRTVLLESAGKVGSRSTSYFGGFGKFLHYVSSSCVLILRGLLELIF
jgi:hypothetical protein